MPCRKSALLSLLFCFIVALPAFAQSKVSPADKFRQLEEILPTPNDYRSGEKFTSRLSDPKSEDNT